MDPFSTASDFILDLIFLQLNEEDLHETLRVSKSWFWASVRRTKKLKITMADNPLKSMAEFYNNHRPADEKLDWRDLFKYLVLDELIVDDDVETTNYLVNNGCNTAVLTIEDSNEESPVTLASLKTIARLQSLEYRNNIDIKWHPFVIECLKSSNYDLDPNSKGQIDAIKLNSSGWNAEDPVLMSVTKLGVRNVTIDFLSTMVDYCPNLVELHCYRGCITKDWHQAFPANVKRIELHNFNVDIDVATVVNAYTDAGRQLLPYLCQNWESVEKFHFDLTSISPYKGRRVYEAFPQQREEVFVCRSSFNKAVNLGCAHFQSRKIHVGCYSWDELELIPSTKSVKLLSLKEGRSKFSPRDACLEPENVESFSFTLGIDDSLLTLNLPWGLLEKFAMDPFKPNSFEGFSRLASLTLSHVSALSIKMALDQCPSIKKLKLKSLKKYTFGSMPMKSSYANVCKLVLADCEETMQAVFQVFPCLSKFKQSDGICKAGDWLWRHLIEEDKKYGVSFEHFTDNWYMVSDDLQASLSQAQKLLNEFLVDESVCYLKGFKLIPRVSKQKVIYVK